jgi:hypothetical protein
LYLRAQFPGFTSTKVQIMTPDKVVMQFLTCSFMLLFSMVSLRPVIYRYLQQQYLHFCTSKASKLRTRERQVGNGRHWRVAFGLTRHSVRILLHHCANAHAKRPMFSLRAFAPAARKKKMHTQRDRCFGISNAKTKTQKWGVRGGGVTGGVYIGGLETGASCWRS